MIRKLIWFFTPFWIKRKLHKKFIDNNKPFINSIRLLDLREIDDEIDWINAW